MNVILLSWPMSSFSKLKNTETKLDGFGRVIRTIDDMSLLIDARTRY